MCGGDGRVIYRTARVRHITTTTTKSQNQIKSPFAAWVEAGPFTWFMDEEESLTPEDKLDALQRLLNQVSVGTGGWVVW